MVGFGGVGIVRGGCSQGPCACRFAYGHAAYAFCYNSPNEDITLPDRVTFAKQEVIKTHARNYDTKPPMHRGVHATPSPTLYLRRQAQSSIVARARATARAEAWASLLPTPTSMVAAGAGSGGTESRSSKSSVAFSSGKVGEDGVQGLKRDRGSGMYARSVGRRRRIRMMEGERAAEREVLLKQTELRTRRLDRPRFHLTASHPKSNSRYHIYRRALCMVT